MMNIQRNVRLPITPVITREESRWAKKGCGKTDHKPSQRCFRSGRREETGFYSRTHHPPNHMWNHESDETNDSHRRHTETGNDTGPDEDIAAHPLDIFPQRAFPLPWRGRSDHWQAIQRERANGCQGYRGQKQSFRSGGKITHEPDNDAMCPVAADQEMVSMSPD